MRPSNYIQHALRVGECTDMARDGDPGSFNKFEKMQRNLDWTDLAILSDSPSQTKARPYVE